MKPKNIKIDYNDFKNSLNSEKPHEYTSKTVRRRLFFDGGSQLTPKK